MTETGDGVVAIDGCPIVDPAVRRVEFWPGKTGDICTDAVLEGAVRVKGVSAPDPLRFLDIYFDHIAVAAESALSWGFIERQFLAPRAGLRVHLGPNIEHPPFTWRDANPFELALSFTYNANALFRILSNLCSQQIIESRSLTSLLDAASLMLADVYRSNDHFVIKNINNNHNMYLISKVVETVLGRRAYDSEMQELGAMRRALEHALTIAAGHAHVPTIEKMTLALGTGVSFMEDRSRDRSLDHGAFDDVERAAYQFSARGLAIDHRSRLLEMICNASDRKRGFRLVVILDDTAESVEDLLWLQDLLNQYALLRLELIVNVAQVSVNFSIHLLWRLLREPLFQRLAARIGSEVTVCPVYCPLMSFEPDYWPLHVRRRVDDADAVYIKGANFFETCQLPEKETFYAFVVYGTMSRECSGLEDADGVFAHVPAGVTGYRHAHSGQPAILLRDAVAGHR